MVFLLGRNKILQNKKIKKPARDAWDARSVKIKAHTLELCWRKLSWSPWLPDLSLASLWVLCLTMCAVVVSFQPLIIVNVLYFVKTPANAISISVQIQLWHCDSFIINLANSCSVCITLDCDHVAICCPQINSIVITPLFSCIQLVLKREI